MNKIKKLALVASVAAVVASARAANPATMDELQTALAGKFSSTETIIISGFVLGAGIVVGMITMHWVNRGSRAKVK